MVISASRHVYESGYRARRFASGFRSWRFGLWGCRKNAGDWAQVWSGPFDKESIRNAHPSALVPLVRYGIANSRKTSRRDRTPVNAGRHEYHSTICSLAQREEIERAFLNWASPSRISTHYSVSRDSIYRHAHALALMEKRRRNVRALEQYSRRQQMWKRLPLLLLVRWQPLQRSIPMAHG